MRQLARRGCQAAWSTSELFLPRVEHFHSAAAHAAAERHGQLATANHGFRIHVLTQERFGRYIATRIFAEDAGSACSLAEIHNGCCDADRSELASTRGMLITQMLVDEQLFSSMPTRWRVPRAGSREPGAGSREPGMRLPASAQGLATAPYREIADFRNFRPCNRQSGACVSRRRAQMLAFAGPE
jgi:hypothetical protein